MAKKNVRELKVCAQSGYRYKDVPSIRLMGQWLEAAGFHIGDPVLVKCEEGQLIITPDTARAELIEAEKAFMEMVQFTVPGGRHSVLERPLSDENSRPFLVNTPAIIGY